MNFGRSALPKYQNEASPLDKMEFSDIIFVLFLYMDNYMKKYLGIGISLFLTVFLLSPISADEKITPPAQLVETQEAFIKIAEIAEPAVVNISSTRIEKVQSYSFGNPFGGNDPFDEFFKHFFPPDTERKTKSVGSGFVIDAEGHILTNYHVIERAKDIQITMGEEKNRKTYSGEIVGSDQRTDIAVIKIKTKEKIIIRYNA